MDYKLLVLALAFSAKAAAQNKALKDSVKRNINQPLLTASPLLGGVNVSDMFAPVSVNGSTFTIQQLTVDESSPVYRVKGTRHPFFIKAGFRYQGLFLANEPLIGSNNFHAINLQFYSTYVVSRKFNISGFASIGVASDFRKSPEGDDLNYLASIRFGVQKSRNLRYGISLTYINNYGGSYLVPLPDIDWVINDKWELESIIPFRTSLKHKLNPKHILGITQGLNGGLYRLNDSDVKKYIQLQQYNTGLLYELHLSRYWHFNLVAGYAISQKLQTFTADQKVSLNHFGAAADRITEVSYKQRSFMLQGGISYKF